MSITGEEIPRVREIIEEQKDELDEVVPVTIGLPRYLVEYLQMVREFNPQKPNPAALEHGYNAQDLFYENLLETAITVEIVCSLAQDREINGNIAIERQLTAQGLDENEVHAAAKRIVGPLFSNPILMRDFKNTWERLMEMDQDEMVGRFALSYRLPKTQIATNRAVKAMSDVKA